jgi:hypothetical protein
MWLGENNPHIFSLFRFYIWRFACDIRLIFGKGGSASISDVALTAQIRWITYSLSWLVSTGTCDTELRDETPNLYVDYIPRDNFYILS